MAELSRLQVEVALKGFIDPYMKQDLVAAKAVKNIAVAGGEVTVDVVLGYPAKGFAEQLAAELRQRVQAVDGVSAATVNVSWEITTHSVQKGVTPLKQVKNVIAVASGKGGVGKSTTAVNLALALAAEGAKVGILDADIYGPSQPRMLGAQQRPESRDGKSMEPVMAHGLQSMSVGYLIDEEAPMIWRGPMVTQALQQLLSETNWRDIDYLVVDLPPGTGDIQLTLAQKIPVSGAVIVTTPQDIALLDARKGLKMFEKVEVPVLGIVESISAASAAMPSISSVPAAARAWPSNTAWPSWAPCPWTSTSARMPTAVVPAWWRTRTAPWPRSIVTSPGGWRRPWPCGPGTLPINSRTS